MNSKWVDAVAEAAANAVDGGAELLEEVEEHVLEGKRRVKRALARAERAAAKEARSVERKLRRAGRKARREIRDLAPSSRRRGVRIGKLVACLAVFAESPRRFVSSSPPATPDGSLTCRAIRTCRPHRPTSRMTSPRTSSPTPRMSERFRVTFLP